MSDVSMTTFHLQLADVNIQILMVWPLKGGGGVKYRNFGQNFRGKTFFQEKPRGYSREI